MNDQRRVSEFAIASLVIGIVSFIRFFSIEKPLVALVLGILALQRIGEDSLGGKQLAVWGIGLGILSIVATAVVTIVMWPQMQDMQQRMMPR